MTPASGASGGPRGRTRSAGRYWPTVRLRDVRPTHGLRRTATHDSGLVRLATPSRSDHCDLRRPRITTCRGLPFLERRKAAFGSARVTATEIGEMKRPRRLRRGLRRSGSGGLSWVSHGTEYTDVELRQFPALTNSLTPAIGQERQFRVSYSLAQFYSNPMITFPRACPSSRYPIASGTSLNL